MEGVTAVIPGILYISSHEYAKYRENLQELEISHVLRLGDDDDFDNYYVTHDDIDYYNILIDDELYAEMTIDILQTACELIASAGGPVLVHCFAGVMKSKQIKFRYLTMWEAYDFLLDRHSRACPNPKFIRDLQAYEQYLLLQRNL
jgi:hypothetical protein